MRTEALVFMLFLGMLASACSDSTEQSTEDVAIAVDSSGIDWETFRRSVTRLPNGALVAEGDMAFEAEEQLYRFWKEDRAPQSGQALTVRTVTVNGISVDDLWAFPGNFNLTYCVGTGFTAAQLDQLPAALDAATGAWSRIVGVGFRRTTVAGPCDATNTSVVFDVQRASLTDGVAKAFFPSDSRPIRTLLIDDDAFTTNAGGRSLTGILTHELGHTIGFRHEHIWTARCEEPERDKARLVTDYDWMSVMHYPECRDVMDTGGYHISALDYYGAVLLYGLAPALVQTVTAT